MPLGQRGDLRVEGGGRHRGPRHGLGHRREAFCRGRSHPPAVGVEPGHPRPHERERQIGPARGHEPRIPPDDDVVVAAVAGIAGREADRDGVLVLRHREFDPVFPPFVERRHGLHPAGRPLFRPELPDDLANGIELPGSPLPPGDQCGDRSGVAGLCGLPAAAQGIKDRGGRSGCARRKRGMERGEILGAQAPLSGHRGDGVAASREAIALDEGREQVFLDRQEALVPDVKLDSLQHRRLRARRGRVERLGIPRVKPLQPCHRLVGEVSPGIARREPEPIGQEHGVGRDPLGGVEILGRHARRHDERLPGVRKTLARAAVGGKLLGGVERIHAREIADRVRVFGVVEPAQDDTARVAGMGPRLGRQERPQPVGESPPFLVGGLSGIGRRHLATGHHLGHPLHELGMPAERGGIGREREVHLPLGGVARVAVDAVAGEHRPCGGKARWRRLGGVRGLGQAGGLQRGQKEAHQQQPDAGRSGGPRPWNP